jgi:hypothetical protein
VAVLSNIIALASTTDGANFTSVASTAPAGSKPLIAEVNVTGNTTNGTLTDSLGRTWNVYAPGGTRFRWLKNGGADFGELWICASLSTTSTFTLTYTVGSGTATGCIIYCQEITSASRVDSTLIRAHGVDNNRASGTAASVVMDQAALTGNTVVTGVFLATSSPGTTVPTSFTLISTAVTTTNGYATPTTGGKVAQRASGHTSATVTWGSAFASAGSAWAIEIDVNAPDTTAPVTTFVSQTATVVSHVSGFTGDTVTWSVNEACQAWEIRQVSASGDAHTTGTLIASGGSVPASTNQNTVIDSSALTGTDGSKLLKLFTQDLAGNWSV